MNDDPFDLAAAPPARQPAAAPYLAKLNEAQREAVEALDGPVLVLAGAGTGKTRVLTTRLAHLLATGRCQPWQVLAVTFTNKASREMQDRLAALVGPIAGDVRLGTFHAIGVWLLRRHAELVGLKSNFTILDTDDQLRLLKQVLEAHEVDVKRWPARALAAVIDRWKDKGLTPDKVGGGDGNGFADGKALELYRAYQARLLTLNACDFGDLLVHTLTLFSSNPDILARYQEQFRYILVDEYQDTNVAQYLWLRLLAQSHHNICCVGDDDQSIYGWRGAEVDNILRFESDFPGAKVVRLERNYRSTGHILATASALIAHNEARLGKTLWTDDDPGRMVGLRGVWDGIEEARIIGEDIEALQRDGARLDDIAILVRAGFQTRDFEERFLTLGLPYRVIGGPRFYERAEIRDAMAYLRMVAQPDDDLALERIINVPKRALGAATVKKLHETARAAGTTLLGAGTAIVETDELRPQARTALARLLDDFRRWRALIDVMPHHELAETVLDESGYTAMWQHDRSPDAPGRLENLKELIRAMEEFPTLAAFLEHVALVMENAEQRDEDMVSLMTLHSAKGLEFEHVFLPGWEEGLFPHQRALGESGQKGLEEERRLAYVGITRARRQCTISFAANRRVHGQWQSSIPSRFVEELPADHVEKLSDPGIYGSGGAGWGRVGGAGGAGGAYEAPWEKSDWRGRQKGYGARYERRGGLIEGEATVVETSGPEGGYALGQRIFHQKFGYGRIRAMDGNKLEIEFEKAGRKKVMDAFVDPA
ncbi:ATP-dependent helicase [Oceanibacterium hippocampi]|uniref:DNA 3'-5' helicase n=1 Tax=Oceanibacterium hippocampi TaxID=745714 RepID=A0A1Y5SCD8_9PROT|nr:UvrD-helicase domain-containing protein [Oceanibacterium hippocampi]SLN37531.1 DNA helicase II [Oceanibacterium hippocampi]